MKQSKRCHYKLLARHGFKISDKIILNNEGVQEQTLLAGNSSRTGRSSSLLLVKLIPVGRREGRKQKTMTVVFSN